MFQYFLELFEISWMQDIFLIIHYEFTKFKLLYKRIGQEIDGKVCLHKMTEKRHDMPKHVGSFVGAGKWNVGANAVDLQERHA